MEDKRIVREVVTGSSAYELYYMYGSNGIVGFTQIKNGVKTNYYYRKNLLGDIVAIYGENGTKYAQYAYDAWGNCTILSDTNGIGALNPFRYREYYYDSEIKLYYLNARYYDPEVGRFISQDSIKYLAPETLNGINLFDYCLNNPVMGYDPDGTWVETVFDLFSLGVSIVEVIINPLDPWAWAGLAGDAFDLIPFVTGAGETIKGLKLVVKGVDFADMTIDTIRIKKATEFTVEAQKKIKTLKKVGKYTESAADAGKIIHNGYRVKKLHVDDLLNQALKPSRLRPDYVDNVNKIIYELKPGNKHSVKAGVKQLIKYKNKLNEMFSMVLELY